MIQQRKPSNIPRLFVSCCWFHVVPVADGDASERSHFHHYFPWLWPTPRQLPCHVAELLLSASTTDLVALQWRRAAKKKKMELASKSCCASLTVSDWRVSGRNDAAVYLESAMDVYWLLVYWLIFSQTFSRCQCLFLWFSDWSFRHSHKRRDERHKIDG